MAARRAAVAEGEIERLTLELKAANERREELEWQMRTLSSSASASGGAVSGTRGVASAALGALLRYGGACTAPRNKPAMEAAPAGKTTPL
jgi:hypothetical protein